MVISARSCHAQQRDAVARSMQISHVQRNPRVIPDRNEDSPSSILWLNHRES